MTRSDARRQTWWVHGTAGMAQDSDGFLIEHLASYLRVKGERAGEIWVHFSVATASTAGAQRLLHGVSIRFRTFGKAEVERVHVWDGAQQVISHDDVHAVSDRGRAVLVGEEPEPFAELTLEIDPEVVESAVSVSVLVRAHQSLDGVALAAVGVQLSEVRLGSQPPLWA